MWGFDVEFVDGVWGYSVRVEDAPGGYRGRMLAGGMRTLVSLCCMGSLMSESIPT